MSNEPYSDLDMDATIRGFVAGQKVFGRYVLKSILGRGGMGVVWLAQDETLGESVALKFLPELVAKDREAVSELKEETLRCRKLRHPGIVAVFSFEQDERAAAIVMEYVDGETLSDMKQDQPGRCFTPEQLAPWVGQLCAALDYAHGEARLVHRDIKPRNLMIDCAGRLRVMDFGLARRLADSLSRVSIAASSSGTPPYMSPQQALGERASVGDDVYSLGATLYDLLTGKPPFYSGNIYEQLKSVVPPSLNARREEFEISGGPIPAAWEETVSACLAKDPAQRPQSAGEVWERLKGQVGEVKATDEAVSEVMGVEAKGGGFEEGEDSVKETPKIWSGVRRWPMLIAAISVLVAVLAGVGIWMAGRGKSLVKATFINSLGMEFVPVPETGVLFCRWETRVKDYAAFAAATGREVKKPEFSQTGDHPVVNVTWEDAKAFCEWLGKKEGREYRLPSDEEWSVAVGLPKEDGDTPRDKSGKAEGYPWGVAWPPPHGAGNYGSSLSVDEYEKTSPVGSFAANRYGLYDMGGNVWEWCEDWYDSAKTDRVLRGASCYGDDSILLRSSCRGRGRPGGRHDGGGFRVVLVVSGAMAATVAPETPPVPHGESVQNLTATIEKPFINSLGMQFVPVSGIGVLFCRWETRVKDYAAFAAATGRAVEKPVFAQTGEHPVVNVSWEDAKAFCEWLSKKEGREYRLPSDEEWSASVGLPKESGDTPSDKSGKADGYPWGDAWPPPKEAGNYDPSLSVDEYAETSPVESFAANALGIYDLGGNVWEWCEDWYDSAKRDRVLRGASWGNVGCILLRSSCRGRDRPGYRIGFYGFRVVLVVSAR
jgi:formylglycine-generating enzyme required for sulfatase activity